MLLFISKGSRHPAAAGGDNLNFVIDWQFQSLDRRRERRQRLLMAVAVQFDMPGLLSECFATDATCIRLAGDEFIDQEGVGPQCLGGVDQSAPEQDREPHPETRESRRARSRQGAFGS